MAKLDPKAKVTKPKSESAFSRDAFLLVAEQNMFRGPQKPTDGDKKKKKKKGSY
jgi:hypothetical protein